MLRVSAKTHTQMFRSLVLRYNHHHSLSPIIFFSPFSCKNIKITYHLNIKKRTHSLYIFILTIVSELKNRIIEIGKAKSVLGHHLVGLHHANHVRVHLMLLLLLRWLQHLWQNLIGLLLLLVNHGIVGIELVLHRWMLLLLHVMWMWWGLLLLWWLTGHHFKLMVHLWWWRWSASHLHSIVLLLLYELLLHHITAWWHIQRPVVWKTTTVRPLLLLQLLIHLEHLLLLLVHLKLKLFIVHVLLMLHVLLLAHHHSGVLLHHVWRSVLLLHLHAGWRTVLLHHHATLLLTHL